MKPHIIIAIALFASGWNSGPAAAQDVSRETAPGITNFARLGTIVASAGAIQVAAVPDIKKMGFTSIINLREENEPGASVEPQEAAAKAAGLRYFHIPFNSTSPDPKAADRFLDVITSAGVEPAFIHCFRGGRAATMWFIKRLVVDHWDKESAEKEAIALGMSSPVLKEFAIAYAQTHKR